MTHLCCRICWTWITSNSNLQWCSIPSFSGPSSLSIPPCQVFKDNSIQVIQESLGTLEALRPPRYCLITIQPLFFNLPHSICRLHNSLKHLPPTSPSSTSLHRNARPLLIHPLVAPFSRLPRHPPSTTISTNNRATPTQPSCSPFSTSSPSKATDRHPQLTTVETTTLATKGEKVRCLTWHRISTWRWTRCRGGKSSSTSRWIRRCTSCRRQSSTSSHA